MMSTLSIIVIGPSTTGKSTLSKRLAKIINWTSVDLDLLRWDYLKETDYDFEKAKAIRQESGFEAVVAYWDRYDLHCVWRIAEDYPHNHVIAFGAGHSIFDDLEERKQVKQILSKFPQVILLLPTPDVAESLNILDARMERDHAENVTERTMKALKNFNRKFIDHPSNTYLATHTVYTHGKSVDETCAEILRIQKKDQQS